MQVTIVTLSNGKKVANFSSPHPFVFEDGTVLPAVSNEESNRLKVDFIETTDPETGDTELAFDLNDEVLNEMDKWIALKNTGEVDVVFCPLPMITAIKQINDYKDVVKMPFRAIRIEDRIKKLLSISKQCL